MKILYAIQGTGNGHISRARDIIPILQLKGDVDILVSGDLKQIKVPFKIDYRLHGLGFTFGKKGGIDLWNTYKNLNSRQLWKEIKSVPIEKYDVIINDFEPITAWAGKLKKIPIIALSHQSAVLNKKSPKPESFSWMERLLLRWYAPAKHHYGFHFDTYHKHIFTPVIRSEIRRKAPVRKGHYTVYLPAYSDRKIIKVLSQCKEVKWHVFSKHSREPYIANNIIISPINNEKFIDSLVSSEGVLCGAGFETPAEALFLRKKLLVIPMKTQFEQRCNAASLHQMGIPVIKKLSLKYVSYIKNWIQNDRIIKADYPDITAEIINMIFERHAYKTEKIKVQITEIGVEKLPLND